MLTTDIFLRKYELLVSLKKYIHHNLQIGTIDQNGYMLTYFI